DFALLEMRFGAIGTAGSSTDVVLTVNQYLDQADNQIKGVLIENGTVALTPPTADAIIIDSIEVLESTEFVVPVRVVGMTRPGLGAFDLEFTYDPDVIELTDVRLGDNTQDIFFLTTVLLDPTGGTIRTSGYVLTPDGPTDDYTLFELIGTSVGSVGGSTALELSNIIEFSFVGVDEEYVVVGGDKDAVGVEQDARPPAGEEVTVGVEDQHPGAGVLEDVGDLTGRKARVDSHQHSTECIDLLHCASLFISVGLWSSLIRLIVSGLIVYVAHPLTLGYFPYGRSSGQAG
ncbi:MAG: hypothetical protein IIB11_04220, partial [Chloroflexi bacterium]|nr:hypothetical protein [Chloroflexota bacterium]